MNVLRVSRMMKLILSPTAAVILEVIGGDLTRLLIQWTCSGTHTIHDCDVLQ
jgi:hypothetical protein